MDSISRCNRCERFEKEFGADYVKKVGIDEGPWKVEKQFLATEDGNEVTRMVVVLKNEKGKMVTLLQDFTVFDPEATGGARLVENLNGDLGIDELEAEKRLVKAGLFDEVDVRE